MGQLPRPHRPTDFGHQRPHVQLVVGVIEIVAGLIVLVRPQIGAYIVGLWLLGIIVNLLLRGGAYDIGLRDFGLSLGAFALARISAEFNPRPIGV